MPPTIQEALQTSHSGRPTKMDRSSQPAPPAQQEEIARLAHRYWEERQKSHLPGSDLDDWLRAETVLRAQEAAIDEASEESFPASDPPAR